MVKLLFAANASSKANSSRLKAVTEALSRLFTFKDMHPYIFMEIPNSDGLL